MKTRLEDTKKWEEGMDICHPLNSKALRSFGFWILTAGFRTHYGFTSQDHGNHVGHDFMKYQPRQRRFAFSRNNDDPIYLNENVEVHAVADGVVEFIRTDFCGGIYGDYPMFTAIAHNEHGLASGYCHMIPKLKVGDAVKRGQVIGHLHPGIEDQMLPAHLHFELGVLPDRNYMSIMLEHNQDPLVILPNLRKMSRRWS